MIFFLEVLTLAGLVIGAALTVLGLFAPWNPWLELVNQGRMLVLIGAVAVIGFAMLTGNRWLTAAALVIAIVNAALFAVGFSGAAASATPGSERFLRLLTLNIWKRNPHIDDVAAVLREADADIVVLQEVSSENLARIEQLTKSRYPYRAGEAGLVILTKHPIKASGHLDGPALDGRSRTPLALLAKFEIRGFAFEVAGVHIAFPFRPHEQVADTDTLIGFIKQRKDPLLVAGDYNLTPWTDNLRRLTSETGLLRYNTLRPTWPTLRKFPLIPLIPLDHVFSSREFARLSVATASGTGSDHLALIVDIALAKSALPGSERNQ
jgi:endonuclease/exonuclease/phosphatase (EEP) superfamily protein YafD